MCTVVLMDSAAETGGLILFTSAFDSGWWVKPKAHRIRHTVALYVARKRISYASILFQCSAGIDSNFCVIQAALVEVHVEDVSA